MWMLPQRLNEKIREYFQDPTTPVSGGEWLKRSEIPTSEEILDKDITSTGVSTGGSSDVVLIPNKRKGAWQSKGEPCYCHRSASQRSDRFFRDVPQHAL